MEQVWNFVEGWGTAVAVLLYGGLMSVLTVIGFAKWKQFGSTEMVLRLAFWVALMAVGVLHVLDLVRAQWVWANFCAVLGLLWLMEGTGIISRTGGVRKWLQVLSGAIL
ncbi:MAG: hypothetical protein AB1664_14945, partial [Thermodesulfobacteriota bacterium]